MKKSLLAIVVGALAVASTANAGLYADESLSNGSDIHIDKQTFCLCTFSTSN